MSINNTNTPSTDQAPAGSSPASGSGDRSRSDGQTPTNLRHGSAIREAKGRVPLNELRLYLRHKAAMLEDSLNAGEFEDDVDLERDVIKEAADFRLWLAELEKLRRAPRPQSERSEAQRSGPCFGQFVTELHTEFLEAAKNERARGNEDGELWCATAAERLKEKAMEFIERVTGPMPRSEAEPERAGLPNDQRVAPPESGQPDTQKGIEDE